MVRFLLGAGADQEHKTDEMHTALMEASMVGGAEGGACGVGMLAGGVCISDAPITVNGHCCVVLLFVRYCIFCVIR